jgi:hypothetical protein
MNVDIEIMADGKVIFGEANAEIEMHISEDDQPVHFPIPKLNFTLEKMIVYPKAIARILAKRWLDAMRRN